MAKNRARSARKYPRSNLLIYSISTNGKHYGVRVRGLIFDNLSAQGMTETDWIADFHCPSDEFTIAELGA
jgi:Papain fold toxin 2